MRTKLEVDPAIKSVDTYLNNLDVAVRPQAVALLVHTYGYSMEESKQLVRDWLIRGVYSSLMDGEVVDGKSLVTEVSNEYDTEALASIALSGCNVIARCNREIFEAELPVFTIGLSMEIIDER